MHNRWYEEVDWVLFSALVLLALVGIATIYSAGAGAGESGYAYRQAWWMVCGAGAFLGGFALDRRALQRWAYLIYGAVLAVLLAMPVIGGGAGVHRWIVLGPVSLQPAEFAKIALLLALGRYFQELRAESPFRLLDLLVPLGLVGAYVAPVALQPDLGSALFLALIAAPVFVLMGVRLWTWVSFAAIGSVLAPVLYFSLRPYQRTRILSFLDPGRDPMGAGYHVVQSKIAIGSGGFLGKGYLEGTQSQLHFIPEQHTDFIFSVLAEEWGFIGAAVLVATIAFVVFWAFTYYKHLTNRFGVIVVTGIAFSFAFQSLINLGMTSGVLPVVGLPLPLVSYGGSSMVTTFFAFGLVAGFHHRRG
jgi:rod shape determining protein RodA